jgi:hypothetical protein
MVRVTLCLQLLLLVLILKQSYAVSDRCRELKKEKADLQKRITQTRKMNDANVKSADDCMVSGYSIVHVSSLGYSYM